MAVFTQQEYQDIANDWLFAAKLEGFRGVVYCEAEADKYFWQKIFEYKTAVKFDFRAYTKNKTADKMQGSGQVAQFINFVNDDFRICIDSDYYAQMGDFRYKKPFITETQTYSIENHWCYANTIKPFLEQKYGLCINFDFECFLSDFSKIIHKSFVYTVLDKQQKTNFFTITEFAKIVSFGIFLDKNKKSTIQETAMAYLQHIDAALKHKNEAIEPYFDKKNVVDFETQFFEQKDETYLLIQGHTLYDKIIKLILAEIKAEIVQKQFEILPNHEKSELKKHLKHFTDLSQNCNKGAKNISTLLNTIVLPSPFGRSQT
jgi:Protein of unknown function (DUF4435)